MTHSPDPTAKMFVPKRFRNGAETDANSPNELRSSISENYLTKNIDVGAIFVEELTRRGIPHESHEIYIRRLISRSITDIYRDLNTEFIIKNIDEQVRSYKLAKDELTQLSDKIIATLRDQYGVSQMDIQRQYLNGEITSEKYPNIQQNLTKCAALLRVKAPTITRLPDDTFVIPSHPEIQIDMHHLEKYVTEYVNIWNAPELYTKQICDIPIVYRIVDFNSNDDFRLEKN